MNLQELETCYTSISPLVKVYFQQKVDCINPCKLLNDKHLRKVLSMLSFKPINNRWVWRGCLMKQKGAASDPRR